MKQFPIVGVSNLMKPSILLPVLMAGGVLLSVGCTIPSSKKTIPASQANQMQKVDYGEIVKVASINIEGRRTHLGQYGGAVIGGAAALPRGRVDGVGEALAVAAASTVGAIAGQSIEEWATRKEAQEITVKMKNGDLIVIVQAVPPGYQVGDKVHVLHGPGGARVDLALGI